MTVLCRSTRRYLGRLLFDYLIILNILKYSTCAVKKRYQENCNYSFCNYM